MVAETFLLNPNHLTEVNHINEDKTDNSVINLEWCNRSYNINYGNRNLKAGKSNSIPINQYSIHMQLINTWQGATDVEKHLGFSHSFITACCRGKYKTAYGFIWKYA